MADLFGSIKGNRGAATRTGGRSMEAQIQDANVRLSVHVYRGADRKPHATLANIEILHSGASQRVRDSRNETVELARGLDLDALLMHRNDATVESYLRDARENLAAAAEQAARLDAATN